MRRVCSCAVSRPHPRSLSQREREAKEGRPLPPLPPGEGWGEGKIKIPIPLFPRITPPLRGSRQDEGASPKSRRWGAYRRLLPPADTCAAEAPFPHRLRAGRRGTSRPLPRHSRPLPRYSRPLPRHTGPLHVIPASSMSFRSPPCHSGPLHVIPAKAGIPHRKRAPRAPS